MKRSVKAALALKMMFLSVILTAAVASQNLDDRVRSEAAKEWSGFSLRRLDKDDQGALRCTQDIKLRR